MKKVYGLLVLLSLGGLLQANEVSIAHLLKAGRIPKISNRELDLSNLQITSLEGLGQIPKIKKLEKLNLSGNKIKAIPVDSFKALEKLLELDLSGDFTNKTKIQAGSFAGLKNLRKLDFSDNGAKIPAKAFVGLKNLRELNLSKNEIGFGITTDAFKGLPLLEKLNLSDNGLVREISANAFAGLKKLKELNLSYNRIIQILTNAFAGLPNLEELNLSYNRIIIIETDAFTGLKNLKKLDFVGNVTGSMRTSKQPEAMKQQFKKQLSPQVEIDMSK